MPVAVSPNSRGYELPRGTDLTSSGRKICARCIYDDSVHGIEFSDDGVCSYCKLIDRLTAQYGTGAAQGTATFEELVRQIRESGRGKPYDVAIGVSGGTDSSYMLWLAKEYGLRPLAVHYDNTWNTAIATQNIFKVTSALGIDLHTHVCDNREVDDIFRSFMLAGVPEVDGSTDIALAEVMYRAATRFNIGYVFEGHSFIAEGVSPLGKAYIDGAYIADLHRKFGNRPMRTFPNMTFARFLYWTTVCRIQKVRPLWYLPYSKEDARSFLSTNFGWQDYGGHHLENRMTAFHHSYYTPRKFGLDQRNNSLCASVRSGKISRQQALAAYRDPPHLESGLVEYVLKRLGFTATEFENLMSQPPRFYTEYRTYKRRFERCRPLFAVLAKRGLVPMSFYLKYCFPAKAPE